MKSRSPRAALARLARSTRVGSEAGGRSPGHSTPRSDRGSDSRPRTKSDSGVPDLSGVAVGELVTAPNVLIVGDASDFSPQRANPVDCSEGSRWSRSAGGKWVNPLS